MTTKRDRLASEWGNYETNRAGLLKLAGCTPFECDNFSHSRWEDLPAGVKAKVEGIFDPLPLDRPKPTPAPWHRNINSRSPVYAGETADAFKYIAHVLAVDSPDGRKDGPETAANLALIAAAPELLEALQHLTLLISNMANIYHSKAAQWLMEKPVYEDAIEALTKVEVTIEQATGRVDYTNTHDWDEAQGMCLKCGATDCGEPCPDDPGRAHDPGCAMHTIDSAECTCTKLNGRQQ
jgi:hypothetical protein